MKNILNFLHTQIGIFVAYATVFVLVGLLSHYFTFAEYIELALFFIWFATIAIGATYVWIVRPLKNHFSKDKPQNP